MKYFIAVFFALLISAIISAQGFPDAQKQPKFKEQHTNQHKFKKWSHRRHVKRGTVYIESDDSVLQVPICILSMGGAISNAA